MYVIILGCGAVGTRLAYSHILAGHEILLIDINEERIAKIETSIGDFAMLGDATAADTLKNAGIERADAFVATSGSDAANLAACQLAKFIFNVEHVLSIANESTDTNLFAAAGVDRVVSRTDIILAHLAGTVLEHPMAELMRINDRNEKLVAMKIPLNAQSVGNPIGELPIPYGAIIAVVVSRAGAPFVPTEATVLLGGEEVIATCPAESLDELSYAFTGSSFVSVAR